eukprot:scaffold1058_cov163-Amphora_coffeaeformis.AAC.6
MGRRRRVSKSVSFPRSRLARATGSHRLPDDRVSSALGLARRIVSTTAVEHLSCTAINKGEGPLSAEGAVAASGFKRSIQSTT